MFGAHERELIRVYCLFFFQAEDGIRDLVRSRGLGDVYKRQASPDVEAKTEHPGELVAQRHLPAAHRGEGLGVWPRRRHQRMAEQQPGGALEVVELAGVDLHRRPRAGRRRLKGCLLYTSDAAEERSSVDLGGRRIIKKKTPQQTQRKQRNKRMI